jgi:hypothetical protein
MSPPLWNHCRVIEVQFSLCAGEAWHGTPTEFVYYAVMNPDGTIRPGQKEPEVSKEELLKVYSLMIRLHVRHQLA